MNMQQQFGQQQQQGIRINSFLLHETGTYNQQYRRPYHTELTGTTLSALQERLQGADKFQPAMFGGIASQFIKPTATPEKPIDLVNGWDEPRMRFVMEIEHTSYLGGGIVQVILGYTNYKGISHGGHLDDQMVFYINSVMHVRNMTQNTPTGQQTFSTVADSSHILVDNNWSGIYANTDQRMRPEDVYATMQRSHLHGLGEVMDMRTASNNLTVKSSRANTLATDYMANILQNYRTATDTSAFGQNEGEILAQARGYASEQIASRDPFLSAIASIRGMPVGNSFSMSDLRKLDPNVDRVTVPMMMAPTARSTMHRAGQTTDWGGTNRETDVATFLSQAIPSLMMKLAITRIVFQSTNRDFTGAITTTVLKCESFTKGIDLSPALRRFESDLEHKVLREISFDNQTDFAIEMQVDLVGETWIRMSLDGQQATADFVTPSFCDALTVPIITSNTDLSMSLATDFEMLSKQLSEMCSYNTSANNDSQVFGRI